jgi:hypothetical protein
MKSLFKQPLLHFVLVGLLLFLIYGFFGKNEADIAKSEIYITKGQIDLMRTHWTRQLGRVPTNEEMQGLINDFIREEILMREAIAMGLDKDDIIIRRRLAQKMEFIAGDMLTVKEPDSAEIANYYENNKALFQEPGNISFYQIYFSVDKRAEEASQDLAIKTREELSKQELSQIDFMSYGDRTMLQTEFMDLSVENLKSEFGAGEIVEKIPLAELNQWEGPYRSSFGLHLIYVTARKPAYLAEIKAVTGRIKAKIIEERKMAMDSMFIAEIRSRYRITINEAVQDEYDYSIDN